MLWMDHFRVRHRTNEVGQTKPVRSCQDDPSRCCTSAGCLLQKEPRIQEMLDQLAGKNDVEILARDRIRNRFSRANMQVPISAISEMSDPLFVKIETPQF